MNKDRGVIKWAPFSSLPEQSKIIKKMCLEKKKIAKPILSAEQTLEIENTIIEAYYEQAIIKIEYFQSGFLLNIEAKIYKIDYILKKIYLTNQKTLLFNQIIKASVL
jgi:hypothetical protein